MEQNFELVVITGMSGAGKTVVVQSLEDLGFFCIDNLPPVLFPKFIELISQSEEKWERVALVVDLRGREFFSSLQELFSQLESNYGIEYKTIFLDADDAVLVRRYKETRRKHPLTADGTLTQHIAEERKRLAHIREQAHIVINTSGLRAAELKKKIGQLFTNASSALSIQFLSFGFKHGVPIDADLVFDVRFLPNPHYVDHLRPHTGADAAVYDYVMQWPEAQQFVEKLTDLFRFLFPQYLKEGKTQLVVGIGCTGGKHRSVALTEYFYQLFQDAHPCEMLHRDIKKGG
jgi:RNase adapter protein RapZ